MRKMTEKDIEIYCRMRAMRRDKPSLMLIETSFIIIMSAMLLEGWIGDAMMILGILPPLAGTILHILSQLNRYTPRPYSFPIDVSTVIMILFMTALFNVLIENPVLTSVSMAAVLFHLIFCIISWTKKRKTED